MAKMVTYANVSSIQRPYEFVFKKKKEDKEKKEEEKEEKSRRRLRRLFKQILPIKTK